MYVNVFACMGICSCVSWVACCSVSNLFGEIRTHSCDSNQTTGNPNTLREIRSCAHYGPDTLTIRKLTHEMIRRFVPVRAVKTRGWFSFKTASFHVSVCFYLNSLFSVAYMYVCLAFIIWCDYLMHFTNVIIYIASRDISTHSSYLFC